MRLLRDLNDSDELIFALVDDASFLPELLIMPYEIGCVDLESGHQLLIGVQLLRMVVIIALAGNPLPPCVAFGPRYSGSISSPRSNELDH